MKKAIIVLGLILIIGLIGVLILVSARMTFVQEDGSIYNLYNNEIILEKGWNLINFGKELVSDSEIKEGNIKAIYYYNPSSKQYVRFYPESEEWNNLANQNSCGDMNCNPEERTNYASWCYKDCKDELNDDIVSNLNVISKKTITLKKDVKETIDFKKYYDLQVYWNKNSASGSCSDRGYSNIDCVMLHNDITGMNLLNDKEIINSPNDGNSYNDYFGKILLLSSYTDKESLVYVKADYGSSNEEYTFTFYEIEDNKLKIGNNDLPIPSVQAKIVSQPAWVYSAKRGLLKTESASIKLSQNPLQAGWNFVTITPEFNGRTWNQIKEDCNVISEYIYDAESQKWVNLLSTYGSGTFTFGEAAEQGQGIVVKVSNSCYLKASIGGEISDDINPPNVPN